MLPGVALGNVTLKAETECGSVLEPEEKRTGGRDCGEHQGQCSVPSSAIRGVWLGQKGETMVSIRHSAASLPELYGECP